MHRRFFVDGFSSGRASLRGETARHLSRVLRAEPGQVFELSDGRDVWLGRVEQIKKDAVEFQLVEPMKAAPPTLRTSVLLSIVKFDRFEWCLEKATELGVAEVVPVAAARSAAQLLLAAPKRSARWRKILLESAQQARRLRAPDLEALTQPAKAFRRAEGTAKILLSERSDAAPLRTILDGVSGVDCVTLAIGPEGGWTEEERQDAVRAGFSEASLGGNILRTETAVIAALAAINYGLGAPRELP